MHGCYSELGFPNQLSLAEVYGGSSVDVAAAAAERMKVEMEAACAKLISEGEVFETELR